MYLLLTTESQMVLRKTPPPYIRTHTHTHSLTHTHSHTQRTHTHSHIHTHTHTFVYFFGTRDVQWNQEQLINNSLAAQANCLLFYCSSSSSGISIIGSGKENKIIAL